MSFGKVSIFIRERNSLGPEVLRINLLPQSLSNIFLLTYMYLPTVNA